MVRRTRLSFTNRLLGRRAGQRPIGAGEQGRQSNSPEVSIRALVRRLQANPSVGDAQRAALGITVPDFGATAAASLLAAKKQLRCVRGYKLMPKLVAKLDGDANDGAGESKAVQIAKGRVSEEMENRSTSTIVGTTPKRRVAYEWQ